MVDSFKIAGIRHTVEHVDNLADGTHYGEFNDAKQQILIADRIKIDDEWVDISDEMKQNTFYHELFHSFQFYQAQDFNERDAQIFANFMCEFINTKIEANLY